MVDKTMMGDKCAELVRAAMIGALAVTLGNPTAVYAAEEETADPGQIGIEIAGEAAVGAASFCVEEDAAEEAPAEAEEVTESEGTQNDEMEQGSVFMRHLLFMMRWKRKVDPREKKMRQSRRNRNRRSLTAERMQE